MFVPCRGNCQGNLGASTSGLPGICRSFLVLGREGEGASAVIAGGVMRGKVRKMISKAGCCRASAGRIPIESRADARGAAAESHLCPPFPAALLQRCRRRSRRLKREAFMSPETLGGSGIRCGKGMLLRSEKPQQGPPVGQTPGTSVPWGFLQPHHGRKTPG